VTYPRIECVVFDIDDTLYLEKDYVRSGFAAVGAWAQARHGITSFSERCWNAFEAGARHNIFDDVLASYGFVEGAGGDLVAELVERYRRHPPSISLLPDADGALYRLSGFFRLAAVSDGPLDSQRAKVRALSLMGRLEPIVLTEELGHGRGKPNPAAFRLIEDRWEVGGDRCVYVADNPVKDFQAPAALGWRTVRVRRTGGLHEKAPSGPDVDFEVATLAPLDFDEIVLSAVDLRFQPR
jgi:putative hydrolase of the HAD superfamily